MISLLPSINATLNALSAVLLVWGYLLIRRKQIDQHRRVMKTAFATSCLFLVCYLIYHAQVGSVPFHHEGTMLRTAYLSILLTHTILAATVPVLAIITLRRGLAGRYDRHRKIARWTLPIWLYVSVTGVVVYVCSTILRKGWIVTFDEVRKIALQFDHVEEGTSYGTPAFKVRGKLVARLREDGETLVVGMARDQREELLAADPDTYYLTDHYLNYPWILVRLPVVHPDALRDLLGGAVRLAASVRRPARRH